MDFELGIKKTKIYMLTISIYIFVLIVLLGAWAIYYMIRNWYNDYGGLFYACLILELMFIVLVLLIVKTIKGQIHTLKIDNKGAFTLLRIFEKKSIMFSFDELKGYSKNMDLIVLYLNDGQYFEILNLFIEDFDLIEPELLKLKLKYLGEESQLSNGLGRLTSPKYLDL